MDTPSSSVQFLDGIRAGGFPVKCLGGVSPQQGWGPSVCSCKGNRVFFFFISFLFLPFFYLMGKRALCLN